VHQQRVPKTKVEPAVKEDKFWFLVNNILMYLQLCVFGRRKLATEKRLDSKTDFRLITEYNLCLNLLLNTSGVSKTIITTASQHMVYDETGKVRPEFEEELRRFCDSVSPVRSLIISGPEALSAAFYSLRKRV